MKIYKNNVCVTMDLNEFHDILESNLFDELLLMILELDADDSPSPLETIYGDDYELASHQVYHVDDMDSFMELLKDALDDEGVQYFYGHDMVDGEPVDYGEASWYIEDLIEEPKAEKKSNGKKKANKADAKVKRVLDRYKDVGQ